ncbi:unnamed protein product, partial [Prorocentrum cordatum]
AVSAHGFLWQSGPTPNPGLAALATELPSTMEVLGAGGAAGAAEGGQVWIENHPTEGWTPGRVDSVAASGCYIVVDESGQQFEVPQDKARPVDTACLRGVDDLLALGDFNEGGLLHNVRVRYFRDEIYTGIGTPILISMNPFAKLPGLYSEEKQRTYRDTSAAGGGDLDLPPHLFSVGAASYTAMLTDVRNQSIIISGESGAGKTEATKRILAYFANLQGVPPAGVQSIEDQVLKSNPILEGFGNAKTIRNDNSSRFGKYIDIQFDTAGKLKSARVSSYLLEKSRIVKQQPDERGYHAFYQLCAGTTVGFHQELSAELGLQSSSDHQYICGTTDIAGVDDAADFAEMVDCMKSLGFSDDERDSVFKIAASVLHLGDLEFQEQDNSNDGSRICDMSKASQICRLLQVDETEFAKVFQFRTLEDPFTHKIIDMPQKEQDASNTRHSMAKCLYSRLFEWLVWRINESTKAKEVSKAQDCKKIGILDIYGFEVFDWNSFEQLCINFANEKLQQHFNSHMFTMEQQLYSEEGISWSHIEWQDNREIIDTLEKKPVGLFPILDSECLMPNGNDTNCLGKIWNTFKSNKVVYKPSRFGDTRFAIAHYAGEVIYDIVGFLEKNIDKLHNDIINLGRSSSMPLLKALFSDPRFALELAPPPAAAGRCPTPRGATPVRGATTPRSTTPTRGGAAAGAGARAKQNVTVSMMFRLQLDQLVDDLNQTNPRYIRCIKPNANKAPHEFDSVDVQRQLRCAGMLESIRIRRAGYSVRRPFKDFYNRFRLLCPGVTPASKANPDFKDLSQQLLSKLEARWAKEGQPMAEKSWQVGRSKVFMKEALQEMLERGMSTALHVYVVRLQTRWRACRARRLFLKTRASAAVLQAGLRTIRAATAFQLRRRRLRCAAVALQRRFRGWSCRRKFGRLKGEMAAERIQRIREEEEQREELAAAKRAAEERRRAEEEAQARLERERAEELARQAALEKEREAERQRRLEEELASLRAENAALRRRAAEPQADPAELAAARAEGEELRGQLQRARSQVGALEAGEEALRAELRELRDGRLRLEEEARDAREALESERAAGGASASAELSLQRAKAQTLELELEASRRHAERLQEQIVEMAKSEGASRSEGLDDIRRELSKISSMRGPPPEAAAGDDRPRGAGAAEPLRTIEALRTMEGDGLRMSLHPGGRKSLMDQRLIFESLREQFQEAVTPRGERPPPPVALALGTTGLKVSDEVLELRRTNTDLSARVECLERELREGAEEASRMLQSNGELRAELQGLRSRLEPAQDHQARLARAEEQCEALRRSVEQHQRAAQSAERSRAEGDRIAKGVESENKRLREELNEVTGRLRSTRDVVNRLTIRGFKVGHAYAGYAGCYSGTHVRTRWSSAGLLWRHCLNDASARSLPLLVCIAFSVVLSNHLDTL